jgi:hypothetical protein
MVAVVTPNSDAKIPLNEVAESYVSWYVQHVMTQGGRPALNNVMKEIESSAMSKFLQPQVNGTLALHRVRLVGPGGNLVLAPGEEMLVNVEARGGRPDRQPEPVTPHWWEGADSGAGVEPFLRDPPTTGCVAGCSVAEDDRRMLLAAAGRA